MSGHKRKVGHMLPNLQICSDAGLILRKILDCTV